MSWKARYDIFDKKIYDAVPGTVEYFHEERHKWQDEQGIFSLLFNINYFIAILCIFLSMWKWDFLIVAPFMTLVLMILVEVDAWIYAYFKGVKKK